MTLVFRAVDPSDEAFRACWNARVAENELSLDLEFLRLLADAEPGVAYHFVQAADPAGQVRALACYSLAQMRVMRFVPLRVLVLGGTIAAGKAFWFDDAGALDFASFLAGFEAFVRAQVRCDILVLKEFSPGRDNAPLRSMAEAGFIARMCYDRSRLALPPDGRMQSFLDSLPSKKRRYLRQVMAQGEAAALETAVHERFDHLADAAYALYLAVNARASEARTPALPRGFFAALGQLDATRMLTVSQGGKMIGFGLLMQRGAKLKCLVIGLDYEVSRELQLWYQIVVRAIEHALHSGCTSVDLGSTNHGMKRKFGAEHEDIWIAVRHRSRWVTRLLAPLIRHTLASIYRPAGRSLPASGDAH